MSGFNEPIIRGGNDENEFLAGSWKLRNTVEVLTLVSGVETLIFHFEH